MNNRLQQSIENNDYLLYENIWNENIGGIREILNSVTGPNGGSIGENTVKLSKAVYQLFIQIKFKQINYNMLIKY